MFSFTRSRSRVRIENSWSRNHPKTGRRRNPDAYMYMYQCHICLLVCAVCTYRTIGYAPYEDYSVAVCLVDFRLDPFYTESCPISLSKNWWFIVWLRLYRKNIRLMKKQASIRSPPYRHILTHLPFLLATAQYTAYSWSNPVRILMMKKYLLGIHGYSLQEAAIMVTLPTNISQIIFGYIAASVGDWATRRNIPIRHQHTGHTLTSKLKLKFDN